MLGRRQVVAEEHPQGPLAQHCLHLHCFQTQCGQTQTHAQISEIIFFAVVLIYAFLLQKHDCNMNN